MTDRNKFEQMLEALINEETDKAKEIFHDIVVEKSRDIYESLLESDFEDEEATEGAEEDEAAVEAFGDDEGGEEAPADDEESADDEGGDEFGGDDEFGGEEEGGEDMDDTEQTDRILDLEDALEELKAEFEQLMAGDDMGSDEFGGDDMGGDEIGGDATDDFMGDVEDEGMGQMFEYVDKVALPKHGDNGVNTKSIMAKPNRMGGTSANIAKSFSTEKGGTQGGLANPTSKEENFGNVNVPGGNAGKTAFKKKEAGHGAEKKGSGESADNKKSIIGSRG